MEWILVGVFLIGLWWVLPSSTIGLPQALRDLHLSPDGGLVDGVRVSVSPFGEGTRLDVRHPSAALAKAFQGGSPDVTLAALCFIRPSLRITPEARAAIEAHLLLIGQQRPHLDRVAEHLATYGSRAALPFPRQRVSGGPPSVQRALDVLLAGVSGRAGDLSLADGGGALSLATPHRPDRQGQPEG